MSGSKAEEFQQKVNELKRQFGVRLQDNAEELAALIVDLSGGKNRAGCRERIRQLGHSLAGVAGTFGFGSISDSGANLENAILENQADAAICALAQSTIELVHVEMPAR